MEELTERYRRIGGRSPLDEVTERQRAALERELGAPVRVGMKHWHPRIADAVEAALASGAERVVGVVLAPHYSALSIAGYRNGSSKRSTGAPSSASSRAGTTTSRSSTCSPTASAEWTATSSSPRIPTGAGTRDG